MTERHYYFANRFLGYFANRFLAGLVLVWIGSQAAAEPIVVLEYNRQDGGGSGTMNTHPFRMNPDYSADHKVQQDETLSHIIANYYGGSDIDRAFIQLAVIRKNKSAFVRNNPHYLFAGKTLHLPSLNEIRSMLVNQTTPATGHHATEDNREHIFFFGS